MPQKKNPDLAELVRGKTGRVYGDLIALLTMMKALPLAYNKDMQEDKEALFDAIDTVKKCLMVYEPMLRTARFRSDKMLQAARGGFTNATDLADYLASKGMPFRDAHAVVGRTVLHCIQTGKVLEEIPLQEYREFSPLIEEDIYSYLDIKACVERRSVPGGPAPSAVDKALEEAAAWLESMSKINVW